ncbi:TPA: hypothetical protein ACH3X3_013956 [Trebouxia sp. C0006]
MDQVCQEPCLGQAGGSGWMLVRPAASRFPLCSYLLPEGTSTIKHGMQYLPGFCATLALVMTNCLRREDLEECDSFDEGVYCRSRSWLFLAYLVSFGSIMGSVAVLLKSYALNDAIDVMWPGVAGLFQVTLILAAGLLLFVSRTPAEGSGSTNYGAF